jgi:hypothetical protein
MQNIPDSSVNLLLKGGRGRNRMVVGFTMQSLPIITDVVSLNLDWGDVYNNM